MRSILDAGREPLTWIRAGLFSRTYHLLAGVERIASMQEEGFAGRLARFDSAEGRWTIRASGWLRSHFEVLDASDQGIARFEESWLGHGTLELASGIHYAWRPLDFWHNRRGFVRENGDPVLVVSGRVLWMRHRAQITLDPDRSTPRDLMGVVASACYRFAHERRRAAA